MLSVRQVLYLFASRNGWQYAGVLRPHNSDTRQLMYQEFVVNNAVLVVITMASGEMVHL